MKTWWIDKTVFGDILIRSGLFKHANKSAISPYFSHAEALYMLRKWEKK